MNDPTLPHAQLVWEDLLLAMLAVSLYPLERVLALRENLRQRGLLQPSNLARWGVERVASELKSAGYDRGGLTLMYADRLVSLGKRAGTTDVASQRVLLEGDDQEVRDFLMPWYGIGTTVLTNFLSLRRARLGASGS
jgi:hypothetical protein